MPPMALMGVVTKVGFMNKTATVTVSRYILHKITGKVAVKGFQRSLGLTTNDLSESNAAKNISSTTS